MRKLFLLLFIFSFAIPVYSQFGYYSTTRVLESLPQYAQAVNDYERLCERCEKEIEHNEKELTRLYVAFLDGHRDFPEPILRKRQSELQRLVDNSVEFRKQLKVWLSEAKDSLYAPSYQMVNDALTKVCMACDLDYAIDRDILAYGYINPKKGVDITRMVADAALYPEKPVTDLDGYEDFVREYKAAEPLPSYRTVIEPIDTPAVEAVAPVVESVDSIIVKASSETVAIADTLVVQDTLNEEHILLNDSIK